MENFVLAFRNETNKCDARIIYTQSLTNQNITKRLKIKIKKKTISKT